jgi:hypothetical protein
MECIKFPAECHIQMVSTFFLYFRGLGFRILASVLAMLNEISCDFTQYLQANAGIVPLNYAIDHFLPYPSNFLCVI